MNNFAVVYWTSLKKDNVCVAQFEEEGDATQFAEFKKAQNCMVMTGNYVTSNIDGSKTYKMKRYGAYPVLKNFVFYGALFSGLIIFFVLLFFK